MVAIEFQTTIKNGAIVIPPELRKGLEERVRVILLFNQTSSTVRTLIDELLAHPIRLEPFQPFTRSEIYAKR